MFICPEGVGGIAVHSDRHQYVRNRLIAGLSDRLYVIDAGRNSGANITKEMAKKYGRDVQNIAV